MAWRKITIQIGDHSRTGANRLFGKWSRAVQKQTEADPLLSKRSVCHRSGMVSNLACNFLKHAVGLSENVTLWADAGGKIKQAALHPIRGRDAVARFSLGTVRFLPEDYRVEEAVVNGQAAVIIRTGSQALFILSIEVEAERIRLFVSLPTRKNSHE